MAEELKIGIISDTHNLLRKEVLAELSSCQVILHGGDISKPEILQELQKIAPVYGYEETMTKNGQKECRRF